MISILLTTYNGEKYIAEQIESLLSQTFQEFKLYICDDRSTDGTYDIISNYAQSNSGKIFVVRREKNTGGSKYNFMKMMQDHKGDYVMLCDQDDVWLPDKIEKSYAMMKEMENEHGATMPILIHTDMTVVDENLEMISQSYEKMARKDFTKHSAEFVVTMNNTTGCTAMYNRSLAELIRAEPGYFVMHDWWLTLIAATMGKIGVVKEPTILYRQHGSNDSGAKNVISAGYIYYVMTHLRKMAGMIQDSYRQAGSFLEQYKNDINKKDLELFEAYSSMVGLSAFKKLRIILKYKTLMTGFARKTMQIVLLFVSVKTSKQEER